MIQPTALFNEIANGILDRIPGGRALSAGLSRSTSARAAQQVSAAAEQSTPTGLLGQPQGVGVAFSAIFDYFSAGGQTDTLLRQAIEAEIEAAALRNDLDPNLVRAVIRAESNYRHDAVSHAGAMGLMQLMPRTAEFLGVVDPFDIRQNIDGGARYLRRQLDAFDQNLDLALAAYNAGSTAVRRHGGIPPFQETMNYVPRVRRFMEEYALAQYQRHAEDSKFN